MYVITRLVVEKQDASCALVAVDAIDRAAEQHGLTIHHEAGVFLLGGPLDILDRPALCAVLGLPGGEVAQAHFEEAQLEGYGRHGIGAEAFFADGVEFTQDIVLDDGAVGAIRGG